MRKLRALVRIVIWFQVALLSVNSSYLFAGQEDTSQKLTVIYTISEGMPLSKRGLSKAKKAAEKLGLGLDVLSDPVMPVHPSNKTLKYPVVSFALPAALRMHYPSVAIKGAGGEVCSTVVPGEKDANTYFSLLLDLQLECVHNMGTAYGNEPRLDVTEPSYTLARTTRLPMPMAYFFKALGDEWITAHTGHFTFLASLDGASFYKFQGKYDLVATPDAKFLTLPTPLRFFSLKEFWLDPFKAFELKPVYQDKLMQDSYQTVGITNQNSTETRYRVLTAWRSMAQVRDYVARDDGFEAVGTARSICKDKKFATPIISKDGKLAAGYFYGEGKKPTTKIVNLDSSGKECSVLVDLGIHTSKVDFSFDSKKMTYTAVDSDGLFSVYVTRLSDLKTWHVVKLDKDEAMSFPAFTPSGSVLVYRTNGDKKDVQEYKLIND